MSPVGDVTYSGQERAVALTVRRSRAINGTRMRLETRFLRLKTPVTINSRFGDWRVSWLGGWTRDRLSYLVMLVRFTKS